MDAALNVAMILLIISTAALMLVETRYRHMRERADADERERNRALADAVRKTSRDRECVIEAVKEVDKKLEAQAASVDAIGQGHNALSERVENLQTIVDMIRVRG